MHVHLIDTPGYPDLVGQSISRAGGGGDGGGRGQCPDRHRAQHDAHDAAGRRRAACAA
ncbi:MAG: hypothetical protein MZW92_22015 [Comamonadaceae bacterium]|nr:hypothetical protein [Comamonadaceae bacterium]